MSARRNGNDVASIVQVNPQDLRPHPDNPRLPTSEDPDFEGLVESMRSDGFRESEPIVARRLTGKRLQIVSGHRRCLAALDVGLSTVPVMVEELDDLQARTRLATGNAGKRLSNLELGLWALDMERAGARRGSLARLARQLGLQPENLALYKKGARVFRAVRTDIDIGLARDKGAHFGVLSKAPEPMWLDLARRCLTDGWSMNACRAFVEAIPARSQSGIEHITLPAPPARVEQQPARTSRKRAKAKPEPTARQWQEQVHHSLVQFADAWKSLLTCRVDKIPGPSVFRPLIDVLNKKQPVPDLLELAHSLANRREANNLAKGLGAEHPSCQTLIDMASGKAPVDLELVARLRADASDVDH